MSKKLIKKLVNDDCLKYFTDEDYDIAFKRIHPEYQDLFELKS